MLGTTTVVGMGVAVEDEVARGVAVTPLLLAARGLTARGRPQALSGWGLGRAVPLPLQLAWSPLPLRVPVACILVVGVGLAVG